MTQPGTPEHLHWVLIHHVIKTGHAPDIAKLAELSGLPLPEAEAGLRALERMHGVILVPNSLAIWSLHPFAMMPTQFWVDAVQGGWWANCAWCSLAIPAVLGQDATIRTSDGGERDALEFRVERGVSVRHDLLMHFPDPPARWWDNPYCPCGNILFFSSEAKIDAWCARHSRPKGAILNMATAMGLADRWFGDYASRDWRRKTPRQGAEIFASLGLREPFWNIPGAFR